MGDFTKRWLAGKGLRTNCHHEIRDLEGGREGERCPGKIHQRFCWLIPGRRRAVPKRRQNDPNEKHRGREKEKGSMVEGKLLGKNRGLLTWEL